MCLILVAWRMSPRYPCIVAANRDERHDRAAAAARWWPDKPHVLAGRDLAAGGSWLGLTRAGRFAALTNFRGAAPHPGSLPSRGGLVTALLDSGSGIEEELARLDRVAGEYAPFNVIFSDGARLAVYESEPRRGRELPAGIYGLSNHRLDTPWPKVRHGKSRLAAALEDGDNGALLALLQDPQQAPDHELPSTGISREWERLLSSAFVRSPDYGTRCSTIVRIAACGRAYFEEWSWDREGALQGHVGYEFEVG